mmetsp:Transcript_141648/g.440366  ORF Transcript_141648/g.440366 Transcript_141648/m.440366 type:complete len:155 (-) Transcript_141648:73-537(-)
MSGIVARDAEQTHRSVRNLMASSRSLKYTWVPSGRRRTAKARGAIASVQVWGRSKTNWLEPKWLEQPEIQSWPPIDSAAMALAAYSINTKTMEKMDSLMLSYTRENGGSVDMHLSISEEYGRKRQDELAKLGLKGAFHKPSASLKFLEDIEAKS